MGHGSGAQYVAGTGTVELAVGVGAGRLVVVSVELKRALPADFNLGRSLLVKRPLMSGYGA